MARSGVDGWGARKRVVAGVVHARLGQFGPVSAWVGRAGVTRAWRRHFTHERHEAGKAVDVRAVGCHCRPKSVGRGYAHSTAKGSTGLEGCKVGSFSTGRSGL